MILCGRVGEGGDGWDASCDGHEHRAQPQHAENAKIALDIMAAADICLAFTMTAEESLLGDAGASGKQPFVATTLGCTHSCSGHMTAQDIIAMTSVVCWLMDFCVRLVRA